MSKLIGLVGGVVLLLGGVWWFVGRSDEETTSMEQPADTMSSAAVKTEEKMMEKQSDEMKKDDAMMEKSESTMTKDADTMMKKSRYVSYAKEVFDSSQDTRRVLFFYANWCPFCKDADADFEKNMAQLPADVTLIRVNYKDTETEAAEKELASQYGITYQHSFVQIDNNGKALATWNGGGYESLMQHLK